MNVRDARPGDGEAIRALTLAAYEQYAAMMPGLWSRYRENIVETLTEVRGAAEGEPSQKNPEITHREMRNPEVMQIVAERDGVLLGTVLLLPAGGAMPGGAPLRWPEVRLLAVSPEARGAGVGRALMDECVRRARRAGAAAVTLHTTDMMQVAMRLYERMGFVHAPELDFHPAPQVTVKGYRLELDVRPAGSGC